jgi:hypothetical protein
VGAPNKNRIASELIAQLQGVAQDAWAVEIDQLIALFKFEIKAKDGEAWLKQIAVRDLAVLRKLQSLRELAKHYSGHVNETGANWGDEGKTEDLLLEEIAKAADGRTYKMVNQQARSVLKGGKNGGSNA